MHDDEQAERLRDIYLDIPMGYRPSKNNRRTHQSRVEMTMKMVARFKIISPTIIQHIYKIQRPKALIHLNSLIDEGLLDRVETVRSLDGRVYVLTRAGAIYAQELLECHLPFRSTKNSGHQFNANSVMHDLLMMHCLHMTNNLGEPLWDGYLTELEFKRAYSSNAIRNVDALVRSQGEHIAFELENSHKTYQTHQANLQKYSEALRSGLYSKIFFISASERVLADTRRQHQFALEQMSTSGAKILKSLSEEDIAQLKTALVYRTKFCQELSDIFYP